MSVLLVSLLRGAGYDAYVVSGYATKKITTLDATKNTIKVNELLESYDSTKNRINFDLKAKEEIDTNPLLAKYEMKPVKQLKSKFIERQREKKIVSDKERDEKKRKEILRLQMLNEEEDDDEFSGLRIHAWVLILPGRREIAEPFFIGEFLNSFWKMR